MLAIARLMVMMHHRFWATIAVLSVGIGAFILGAYIQNAIARDIVFGVAIVAVAFVMATGMFVGPMDDLQHRHGSCLLNMIEEMRRSGK